MREKSLGDQEGHDELARRNAELELRNAELERQNADLQSALSASIERTRLVEESHETAMRVARHGLWEWDLVQKAAKLSARVREDLGYPPSRAGLNPNFVEMIHPDDRAPVEAAMMAHIRDGVPYESRFASWPKTGASAGFTRWRGPARCLGGSGSYGRLRR